MKCFCFFFATRARKRCQHEFYALRARERAQTVTLKNSEWQCEAHTTVVICRECERVCVCVRLSVLCCSIGVCPCEWIGGKNKFDNCTRATNEMNKTKMKRHFCRRFCCRCCCRLSAQSLPLPAYLMDFYDDIRRSRKNLNLRAQFQLNEKVNRIEL